MIEVKNLIFEYPGKRALKDISFSINAGSITALVGPNGAGKTTLLRCIAALDEPFSGNITVGGIDALEDPRDVHREIGYLSDFFGVYGDLTVRQCLTFIASIHQIPLGSISEKAELAASRLEITEQLDVKADSLSRGLRQRLGIAQALIHEPKILLLDEPASGLDPEARVNLSKLFLSLKKQGITLVVSSHILAELEDYCTDMLLLRDGNIIEHCSADIKVDNRQVANLQIRLCENAERYAGIFKGLENITALRFEGNIVECTITYIDKRELNHVLKHLLDNGAPVFSFYEDKKKLQDIYMDHAGGGKKNATS